MSSYEGHWSVHMKVIDEFRWRSLVSSYEGHWSVHMKVKVSSYLGHG